MKRTLLILLFLFAGACGSSRRKTESLPADLALAHVTVVDVESGRLIPDRTVLIQANRISAIGPASEIRVPRGAKVVDATGKYLIPGLWDMHSHVTSGGPSGLRLYLAHGVTALRDMGAERFATAKQWRDEIAKGKLIGPRMRIAGPIVEHPRWLAIVKKWLEEEGASAASLEERFGPSTPEEAVKWVDTVVANGADHLKIRNYPDKAVSDALIARARELGVPVFTHNTRQALDAGVASLEHGFFPSLDEDAEKRAKVYAKLVASHTAIIPTFVTREGRLLTGEELLARLEAAREPWFRYVPASSRKKWRDEAQTRHKESPTDWKAIYAADARSLREAYEAGVTFMAGSDAGAPLVAIGSSIHDELALLVSDLGMTPLQALRSATLVPAQFLGLSDSLGSVQTGKLADLVLLDGDPLADVASTRRIRAVIVNGHLYERKALDAFLAEAEEAAR